MSAPTNPMKVQTLLDKLGGDLRQMNEGQMRRAYDDLMALSLRAGIDMRNQGLRDWLYAAATAVLELGVEQGYAFPCVHCGGAHFSPRRPAEEDPA